MDHVTTLMVGDRGNFAVALEALRRRGKVGAEEKRFLKTAFDACSAAGHRGFRPSVDDVNHILDIVERLVQSHFFLKDAARELAQRTPPRPPVVKKRRSPARNRPAGPKGPAPGNVLDSPKT